MPRSKGIHIDIKGDLKPILKSLDRIERKAVPAATVSALNKTGRTVRSRAAKETAAALGVKQKNINQRILFRGKFDRATRRVPRARVRVRPRDINAASLMSPGRQEAMIARTHGPIKRRPKSVVAYKRHTYPNAFVGRGKSNNVLIMEREGKKAQPVEVKHIPHFAKSSAAVRAHLNDKSIFKKYMKHELKRRLKRAR